MIELRPDQIALLQFLRTHGLEDPFGDKDFGYAIHAWMQAAFGQLAPKPWRLLMDRRRPTRVLGYSAHDAAALADQMQAYADPAVWAVCPPEGIASRPMPQFPAGRRLGFEVQCCPVGRKSHSGVEKDLFLIRADAANGKPIRRDEVYCQWLKEQIQRPGAADVADTHLAGFRLVQQTRQTQGPPDQRRRHRLRRPQALIRGQLTICHPDAFGRLLAHGIGRHRAFGYGMLLLRPSS